MVRLKRIITRGVYEVIQRFFIAYPVVCRLRMTMHVQNLLQAWSIEGAEAVISHDAPSFSLMHVLLNRQFRDDQTSLTHGRIRRDFQYN